jgi:hypothetical protein
MIMNGPELMEMAQVAEQEHMMNAVMARARAQQRRERRRQLGPGRVARAWKAFRAPRDAVLVSRGAKDGAPADLIPCTDC